MTNNNFIMTESVGFKILFLKTPLANIKKPTVVEVGVVT